MKGHSRSPAAGATATTATATARSACIILVVVPAADSAGQRHMAANAESALRVLRRTAARRGAAVRGAVPRGSGVVRKRAVQPQAGEVVHARAEGKVAQHKLARREAAHKAGVVSPRSRRVRCHRSHS